MKKIIEAFILIFFLVIIGSSYCLAYPLKVGEKLVYTLKLVGLPIGTQILYVKELTDKETPLYILTSIVKGSDFLSIFYDLEDRIESYVDAENLYPRKVIMDIKEGSRREKIKVIISQNKATVWKIYTGEKWVQQVSSPPLDMLSLIYWIRIQDLKVGKKFKILLLDSTANFKSVDFEVKKIDRVYTYLGVFSALLCQQSNVSNGIKVWFSRDERKIPLQIQVSTSLGFLTAILQKIN